MTTLAPLPSVSQAVLPALRAVPGLPAASSPAPPAPSKGPSHNRRDWQTPFVRRDWQAHPRAETPGNYYAAAQGKEGAALITALRGIVTNGHVDHGYKQARDAMFGMVDDPQKTDTVADVYSGELKTNVSDRKSAFQRGLNAEHTWPQSRGAQGVAQGDLHQLMPSDINTNSKRGHHPFGEVEQVEWSNGGSDDAHSKLGTTDDGIQAFEPRAAVKGNIARALLYFYTRYNEDRPPAYTLGNLKQELPTLLEWHQADPVDNAELERNNAVFSVQGNRNPYVDHPEWVSAAQFDKLDLA